MSSAAVAVRDLEKVFSRRKGLFQRRRRAALKGVTFTMERGECVAILGQNGSGKSTLVRLLSTLLLHDGGEARVFGYDVFKETRAVRRLVNRVSVEASFFKKMSAAENLGYAARFYGMTPRRDARQDPGDPRAGRLPGRAARRADGEPVARHAAEGRARARAADLAGAAAARRADDGARPALEAGGAGRSSARSATRHDSTILLCTHDMDEAEDARRPGRPARPRRAAVPRAGRGREASATASRRSRRRSSPRPGASSRTRRPKRTRRGRCSRDDATHAESRARIAHELIGLYGRRRAEPLPDQALLPVGRRVPALDDREHAHDRLHRPRRRPAAGGAERRSRRRCSSAA